MPDDRDKNFTPKARRFLEVLRELGPERRQDEILAAVPCSKSSLTRWRSEVKGFREREEEIKRELEATPQLTKRDFDTEGLSKVEAEFLRALVTHRDRAKAARIAHTKWAHIAERLDKNPAFRRQFDEVWEEIVVATEDALARKGAEGNVQAARTFLRAHMPQRYVDRVTVSGKVKHTHQVTAEGVRRQRSWLEKFGERIASGGYDEGKALGSVEVIDGEAVEEGEPN